MNSNRRNRRQSFPPTDSASPSTGAAAWSNEFGVYSFFQDFGVRETIESIVIAVILALLFRSFEAEAFIIPTGSMAPTLQGQHMDVVCDKCSYRYRSGASDENTTIPEEQRDPVIYTHCPICNYEMRMRPSREADHKSNNGDRILVNKFVYDFSEPERFDVIVFKNPNNGKQNYIKRLVGLPGENLRIENGDVYRIEDDGTRTIIRKPPEKVRVMLQLVDDTNYLAPELIKAGWPLRWQAWDSESTGWVDQLDDGDLSYHLSPSAKMDWLGYRHLRPENEDWTAIEAGRLPDRLSQAGQLINDYYCYNDVVQQRMGRKTIFGSHWVGDLAIESRIEVKSEVGTLGMRLVEGGARFECLIDVATGEARLTCDDTEVTFLDRSGAAVAEATGRTPIRGRGNYRILFANVDDQLHLWVNNRLIEFSADRYRRDEVPVPTWNPEDPGDAQPLAIGGEDLEMTVRQLAVYRDIYYTSAGGTDRAASTNIQSENNYNYRDLEFVFKNPDTWDEEAAVRLFTEGKGSSEPMFFLEEDQFLPMGDNSPASSDGRIWDGDRFLGREYLIGRAMLIYWPHSLNRPIPYFTPNFGRMGFIR